EVERRVAKRNPRPAVGLGPIRQGGSVGQATADQDPGHGFPGTDVGHMVASVRGDRLGNAACAAADEGPLCRLSVDLAYVVVEEYIGGPRRVGTTVRPDRTGHAARGLDLG